MNRPNNAVNCPACTRWKLPGGAPLCPWCMKEMRTTHPALVQEWEDKYFSPDYSLAESQDAADAIIIAALNPFPTPATQPTGETKTTSKPRLTKDMKWQDVTLGQLAAAIVAILMGGAAGGAAPAEETETPTPAATKKGKGKAAPEPEPEPPAKKKASAADLMGTDEDEPMSLEQLREFVTELVDDHSEVIAAVLEDMGAERVTKLKPAQYAEFVAKVNKGVKAAKK